MTMIALKWLLKMHFEFWDTLDQFYQHVYVHPMELLWCFYFINIFRPNFCDFFVLKICKTFRSL